MTDPAPPPTELAAARVRLAGDTRFPVHAVEIVPSQAAVAPATVCGRPMAGNANYAPLALGRVAQDGVEVVELFAAVDPDRHCAYCDRELTVRRAGGQADIPRFTAS